MITNSESVRSKILAVLTALAVVMAVSTVIGDYRKIISDRDSRIEKLEQEKVKMKAKNAQVLKLSIQKAPLTDVQLAFLLEAVGFTGKALKTAWAVVKKESNGRPMAFNGNARTGDSSYGIFQINMIGQLGSDRRDKYGLDSNKELFSPKVNAEIAFKMSNSGKDWSSWKVGRGYNGNDQKKFLAWYSKFPKGEKV